MTYTIPVCTVKTLDDGQRNCSKHVEFCSKNKFEKLMHLVDFIIRNEPVSLNLFSDKAMADERVIMGFVPGGRTVFFLANV